MLATRLATGLALCCTPPPHVARGACRLMCATPDLSSCTVVQLKEKLRAAGLPVSGRKAELIERLTLGADSPAAAAAPGPPPAAGSSVGLVIEACKQ